MTAKNNNDTDVLLPLTGRITVEGIPCQVRRIRTRELILIVRIITKGVGANINKFDLSSKDQAAQSAALLMVALPNALDEVLLFLREIVASIDPEDATRLTQAMHNPDLDALTDIISTVIEQEWDDAHRLVGKVRALIVAQQTKSPTGK